MQSVSSGPRQNLDAAKAGAVVFGGERIGIDANLADGTFGGQGASAEAVDQELRTVRSRRGTGHGLKFRLEIIGIVGQTLEVALSEDEGAGVIGGVSVHAPYARFVDVELLSLGGDAERDIECRGLAGSDRGRLLSGVADTRITRLPRQIWARFS